MDAAELILADRGNNSFNTASERGIAPAGLVGFPSHRLSSIDSITDLVSAVNVALGLLIDSSF